MRCTLYDYKCEDCKVVVYAKNNRKKKKLKSKCEDCFFTYCEIKEEEARRVAHEDYLNSREYIIDRLDDLEERIKDLEEN